MLLTLTPMILIIKLDSTPAYNRVFQSNFQIANGDVKVELVYSLHLFEVTILTSII
jgi:hypothetical protein